MARMKINIGMMIVTIMMMKIGMMIMTIIMISKMMKIEMG